MLLNITAYNYSLSCRLVDKCKAGGEGRKIMGWRSKGAKAGVGEGRTEEENIGLKSRVE